MTINLNTTTNALKVSIKALKPDHRGQPYSVTFQEQTIITKSHAPSYDACRHLVGIGLSGPLEVWADGESFPRLHVRDIDRSALWTVKEGQTHGPRVVRYVHFDKAALVQRLQHAETAA